MTARQLIRPAITGASEDEDEGDVVGDAAPLLVAVESKACAWRAWASGWFPPPLQELVRGPTQPLLRQFVLVFPLLG